MGSRPGASNGASTHRSAQASRTRSGMRYIHTHAHTSFHTERFSRVDAHEFDEGIGRRGRTPPSRNQSALALCCLSFGCSCAGPARRRAVASPHMYACKHTRWHILTRAALHRFAHEYLLPSTCLSSGLRAFTVLSHTCMRCDRSHRVGNDTSAPARR